MWIFFLICCAHPDLHSFPTRRSSDLTCGRYFAFIASSPCLTTGFMPKIDRCSALQPFMAAPDAAISSSTIDASRSEEHTSELQSRLHLVCRLLLEKKNNKAWSRYESH